MLTDTPLAEAVNVNDAGVVELNDIAGVASEPPPTLIAAVIVTAGDGAMDDAADRSGSGAFQPTLEMALGWGSVLFGWRRACRSFRR